jgi:hypothetical protein
VSQKPISQCLSQMIEKMREGNAEDDFSLGATVEDQIGYV